MKIIKAIAKDEKLEFVHGGVTWLISPLPFGIKKKLNVRTHEALSSKDKVVDLVDISLDAIKYGLKGWKNLKFRNGEDAKFELIKDSDGYECLTDDCLELVYRTSAFDDIGTFCLNPGLIPDYMFEAVKFSDKEEIQRESLEEKKNS